MFYTLQTNSQQFNFTFRRHPLFQLMLWYSILLNFAIFFFLQQCGKHSEMCEYEGSTWNSWRFTAHERILFYSILVYFFHVSTFIQVHIKTRSSGDRSLNPDIPDLNTLFVKSFVNIFKQLLITPKHVLFVCFTRVIRKWYRCTRLQF